MRIAWLYVLCGMTIWPIHWTPVTIGDKPIELMVSDLLVVLTPLIYFFIRSQPSNSQLQSVAVPIRMYSLTPLLALLLITYSLALAGIGMGMTGETMRVYSAFKLAKPMGFVFLGLLMGTWTDPFDFFEILGHVYGVLVAMTMFFTLTAPDFPLGEWGRSLFELDLSGYPNSAMSFYAALAPFLLASTDVSKHKFVPVIGWGLFLCVVLIIVGSMSRSSTIAMFIGVLIYLATTGRIPLLVGTLVAGIILSVIGYGLFSAIQDSEFVDSLVFRIQDRVERSTEQEDPTSGRAEIWAIAFELWTDRPAFGYMFESFSHYVPDVDTPHQQYLEVLHKCGGVGFALYFGLLVSCLFGARRLLRMTTKFSKESYLLKAIIGMMVGIMIGNLTQPNLTFSLTGNMVFLVFGSLCGSRAVVAAGQRSYMPLVKAKRSGIPETRRGAA